MVFGSSAAFCSEGKDKTGHFMGVLGMASSLLHLWIGAFLGGNFERIMINEDRKRFEWIGYCRKRERKIRLGTGYCIAGQNGIIKNTLLVQTLSL